MKNYKHKILPLFGLVTLLIVASSIIVVPLVILNEQYNNSELVVVDVSLDDQSNEKESQEEDNKEENEEMFLYNFFHEYSIGVETQIIYSAQDQKIDWSLELLFPPPERV